MQNAFHFNDFGLNPVLGATRRLRAAAWGLVAVAALAGADAATACPNQALNGVPRTVSAADLYTPMRIPIPAGGPVALGPCPQPGSGWVTKRPDVTLRLTANPRGQRLEFRVESACDAVMLVNSPSNQWFFDDDSNGNRDPKWSIANAKAGIWDIWVGRLDKSELCDATLIIETF